MTATMNRPITSIVQIMNESEIYSYMYVYELRKYIHTVKRCPMYMIMIHAHVCTIIELEIQLVYLITRYVLQLVNYKEYVNSFSAVKSRNVCRKFSLYSAESCLVKFSGVYKTRTCGNYNLMFSRTGTVSQ